LPDPYTSLRNFSKFLRFLFSSVPPGIFRDSIMNYATTASFHILTYRRRRLTALMTEAVSTSEKLVNFYETTRRNIPECCNLQNDSTLIVVFAVYVRTTSSVCKGWVRVQVSCNGGVDPGFQIPDESRNIFVLWLSDFKVGGGGGSV
jgi:hypothetical protein